MQSYKTSIASLSCKVPLLTVLTPNSKLKQSWTLRSLISIAPIASDMIVLSELCVFVYIFPWIKFVLFFSPFFYNIIFVQWTSLILEIFGSSMCHEIIAMHAFIAGGRVSINYNIHFLQVVHSFHELIAKVILDIRNLDTTWVKIKKIIIKSYKIIK